MTAGDASGRTLDEGDAEIIEQLAHVVGARVVIYVAQVDVADAGVPVQAWGPIPAAALARLRLAAQAVAIVAADSGPAVARTWFVGLNPALGDRSPASIIRGGVAREVRAAVLAAAQAMRG